MNVLKYSIATYLALMAFVTCPDAGLEWVTQLEKDLFRTQAATEPILWAIFNNPPKVTAEEYIFNTNPTYEQKCREAVANIDLYYLPHTHTAEFWTSFVSKNIIELTTSGAWGINTLLLSTSYSEQGEMNSVLRELLKPYDIGTWNGLESLKIQPSNTSYLAQCIRNLVLVALNYPAAELTGWYDKLKKHLQKQCDAYEACFTGSGTNEARIKSIAALKNPYIDSMISVLATNVTLASVFLESWFNDAEITSFKKKLKVIYAAETDLLKDTTLISGLPSGSQFVFYVDSHSKGIVLRNGLEAVQSALATDPPLGMLLYLSAVRVALKEHAAMM